MGEAAAITGRLCEPRRSMTLDRFRFLLVETNQFRPGLLVGTQQFVQFGV